MRQGRGKEIHRDHAFYLYRKEGEMCAITHWCAVNPAGLTTDHSYQHSLGSGLAAKPGSLF